MENLNYLPNYRCFKVKVLPPTNTLGTRIKIFESDQTNDKRYNDKIVLSYDYQIGNVVNQAVKFLTDKGFKPVCQTCDKYSYYLLCDNYGDNYKTLTYAAKIAKLQQLR